MAILAGLMSVIARADPAADAIVAAMRLSEQASYSWVATVVDDARTYDIHGQTDRTGYARVRMPVVNSVRRQLGRSVTDTQVEFIFRGKVACVIETDDGWKRPDELPPAERTPRPPAVAARTEVTVTANGTALPEVPLPSLPPLPGGNSAAHRRYSNLQLGVSLPHEELGLIVSSHRDLVADGNTVSGTLTDLGARLLLVREGQDALTPVRATGAFKLWLRDGAVTRYEITLEGTLHVQASQGVRPMSVRQVTRTVIKDVGTTQVYIPDEARAKLN
ncbi:hypothetical protein [Horticoccus sp. 23ND18S-11]|uniref:hypothetical protein n=1 Tax=Horticoccus sp. 23ND18S-11 TaxID=3391832 RepID=UPI0039C94BF3